MSHMEHVARRNSRLTLVFILLLGFFILQKFDDNLKLYSNPASTSFVKREEQSKGYMGRLKHLDIRLYLNLTLNKEQDDDKITGEKDINISKLFNENLNQQHALKEHLVKKKNLEGFRNVLRYLTPHPLPTSHVFNGTKTCRFLKKMLFDVLRVCVVDVAEKSDVFCDIQHGFHENFPTLLFLIKLLRLYRTAGVIDIGGPVSIYALIANHLRHKAVVVAPLIKTFSHFNVTNPDYPYMNSVFCFNNIIERERRTINIEPMVQYDTLYRVLSPKDEYFNMSVPVTSIKFTDIKYLVPFRSAVLCVDMRGCSLDSLVDIPLLLDKMDIIAFIFDWIRMRDLGDFENQMANGIAQFLIEQLKKRDYKPMAIKGITIDQTYYFEKNMVWIKGEKFSRASEVLKNKEKTQVLNWKDLLQQLD